MKNNYVAKHANTYNRSSVQKDRKRANKQGYIKHKGRNDAPSSSILVST